MAELILCVKDIEFQQPSSQCKTKPIKLIMQLSRRLDSRFGDNDAIDILSSFDDRLRDNDVFVILSSGK